MADENGDITVLKKTRISAYVDEALPDILVVTYEFGLRIFKGVLLDSTKRNLPCGVPFLNPAFNAPSKNPDDDPLYAVNQRFAYCDPNAPKKKSVQVPSKYKNSKMTVRLRPRQVLCSKCKGICNENSENVSRKRKSSDIASSPPPPQPTKRGPNARITRSVKSYLSSKRKLRGYSEEENETTKNIKKVEVKEEKVPPENPNWVDINSPVSKKPLSNVNTENEPQEDPLFIKHSAEHSSEQPVSSDNPDENFKTPQPTQTQALRAARRTRKKKSAGTTDEEDNKEKSPPAPDQSGTSFAGGNLTSNTTRTIKISYGPQGEGTVLKIPAQIDSITDDDSEENVNIGRPLTKMTITKAARKAMKRAKKEARRKVLLGGSPLYLGGASPRYALASPALGGASPRYALGSSSPRYTVGNASPRQGFGSNSPRYMISPFEIAMPRRRKHKMKHKKKHKDEKDRKHKESEVSSSTQDETKEQCITQKLSINLKRLNNTYTPCTTNEDTTSSSDEQGEQYPDFPPPNPPLMLRINAQTLSSALGADGVRLLVGDVVWGKIHGFPWWPGKILTITNCNSQGPQAHVAWYGSSTSSLMQCDQLSHYLDNFKVRFNKKKKGPYKEAIKQATTEARENAENRVRQPLGNSPSHNIIPQVVPPALASPREIDVVS